MAGYQQSIHRIIVKCDGYIQKGNPAYINRAIRYYSKYIPYYQAKGTVNLEVAKMYLKRAEAYRLLGNMRMVASDEAAARRLNPNIQTSAAPATPPATNPGKGAPPPETAPKPPAHPEGLPPHEGPPIPIAVMDFETVGGDKAYGKTFSPLLAEDLFNRGRFDLIERTKLTQIMAEKKFSETDLVAKAGTDEAQDILQVRFLVTGTITVEGRVVTVSGKITNWKNGKIVATRNAKKLCDKDEVSFYFDEIAHELGVKLEKALVKEMIDLGSD
jgi:curli biogenesis system outer membrane secretion channel CsgG